MLQTITNLAANLGVEPRTLILLGLFFGSLLVFLSLVSVVRDRNSMRVRARMRAAGASAGGSLTGENPVSLFVAPEITPGGLAKAFVPTKQRERNKVKRDLVHAGFSGPNAVLWYYSLRVVAGLLLPGLVALTFLFREELPLPAFVSERMGQVAGNQLLLVFAVMILIGFYGPSIWLSARTKERKYRIELGFPNALDLMQVSIETGLGFDAALARVSHELQVTAPEIAQEFSAAQQEILAGRDRDGAFHAMADRLAIDEAYSFVNVVLQSIRFGTSMSQSLLVYSGEMRQRRELRAQEKANKLPVLMSGVMALLMMPCLLIVTIGPVILRYIHTFAIP
jgi:tight adherence protein C